MSCSIPSEIWSLPLNLTPTSRNYVIVYVNDKKMIRYYIFAGKYFDPPYITTSRGGFVFSCWWRTRWKCWWCCDNNTKRSVRDVNYWSEGIYVQLYRHENNDNKSQKSTVGNRNKILRLEWMIGVTLRLEWNDVRVRYRTRWCVQDHMIDCLRSTK